ncbi:hypothetical protein DFH06DRAFT_140384, partial [Mycena polygramma]
MDPPSQGPTPSNADKSDAQNRPASTDNGDPEARETNDARQTPNLSTLDKSDPASIKNGHPEARETNDASQKPNSSNLDKSDVQDRSASADNDDPGSRETHDERLIDALRGCFAELSKNNAKQIHELQMTVEALRPKPTTTDKKTNFWNLYKTLADEHDREFLQKYSTDLDTSLIFAGLFSAVSSAFIIQIQPEIQPHNTLRVTLVAQCLLYVSLCSTLLAALLAVLGKQWLMYYSAAGERGTVEARGLERQRKLDGLRSWKFDTVLQIFPLLLQFGLLVFGAALSVYLWKVHLALAVIVVSFTAFGFLSYISLLLSAIIFPDSPFQTPLAPLVLGLIPTMIRAKSGIFYSWASSRLKQLFNDMPTNIFCSANILPLFFQCKASEPHGSTQPQSLFDATFPQASPEVSAILWTLETSTDPNTVDAAAELAITVQWPRTIDARPQLYKLYDAFLSCFDHRLPKHVDLDVDSESVENEEMIQLIRILNGNPLRAICLGRAYGVLHCAVQAAESKSVKEKRVFMQFTEPSM